MKAILKKLELLGHLFFYVILKLFGKKCACFFLYPVIFCYVLFSRKIHTVTTPYLKYRFPDHGRFQRFFDTFKNVHSFGQVLVDRIWLSIDRKAVIAWEVKGKEKILEAVQTGKGAVLITAHVGNWQTALAKLNALPVKVHALMQRDQFAEAKHFLDLNPREQYFDIIDVDGPFGGMIEAKAALQRGEIVTIMADRYIKGSAKSVEFFGKEIKLPDAAYGLAAFAEAPVLIFLAAKTGTNKFELQVWDMFFPKFVERDKRDEVLQQCCQIFASTLQKYLQLHPYQWYNFFNIWDQDDTEYSLEKVVNTTQDRHES